MTSIIDNTTIHDNYYLNEASVLNEINVKCDKLCFIPSKMVAYLNSNSTFLVSKEIQFLMQVISSTLIIQNYSYINNENSMFNAFYASFTIMNSALSNISSSNQIISSNLTLTNVSLSGVENSASLFFINGLMSSIIQISSLNFTNSNSNLLNVRDSSMQVQSVEFSNISTPTTLIQAFGCSSVGLLGVVIKNCTASAEELILINTSSNVTISQVNITSVNFLTMRIQSSNVSSIDLININSCRQGISIASSSINSISRSNFTSNGNKSIRAGGSISIIDSEVLVVNSTFQKSTAASGGAISFECTSLTKCNLVVNQTIFQENTGINQGGAIYYNYNRPKLANLTFIGNNAGYGINIASYPVKIRLCDSTNDSIKLTSISSGNIYSESVKLCLVDYDNQTMALDNVNQVILSPINKTLLSLSGTNNALLRSGVGVFSNIIALGNPGSSNLIIQASSKSVDSIKIIDVYGSELSKNYIYASFRFCMPGEIQMNSTINICAECSPGTYSLEWNSTTCIQCLQNSNCLGKDQISVSSGYWRRTTNSTKIVQCLLDAACKGGYVENSEYPVICSEGYEGVLCSDCVISNDTKYQKVSNYECQKCPNAITNALRVIGLGLLVFIFFMLIIIVNIRKTKESEMSILNRSFILNLNCNYIINIYFINP